MMWEWVVDISQISEILYNVGHTVVNEFSGRHRSVCGT